MGNIIIKNGFVITMDKKRPFIKKGIIEIKDNLISHVGTELSGNIPEISATCIDAGGKVVMPGFINGHTHLCMTFGRTVGFELDIMSWISKNQYPLMDEMGEQGYYLAELVGCMENLKNGNTTVVENLCSSNKDGVNADEPSVKGFKETGLRGVLAISYADQNYHPNAIEKKEDIVSRCREFINEYHNSENGKLLVSLGPVVPWACSEGMYKETIRFSEEFNVNLHIHASENVNWNTKGKEVHGPPTNIGIFKKFGCLGPNTNIAAMRIFSEEDIADLRESGCSVIFDPTPSLNWGTGLPPISRIKSEGIAVGLGTNGASSNFGQDMFETMKNAIAIAKTVDGSPEALPLYEALEMATINNAMMLGLGAHVGSLEVGKKADIITVGLTKPHHTPCLNVLAATVLSSRGSDVEEVIVDGNIVINQGKLVNLDEESIIKEANGRALHCAKKAQLDERILSLF